LFEINKYHFSPKISLDFYLPDHCIALEFNGLYWHSTARRPDKMYHRRKYEACRDAGVRLVMINEDEWLQRGHAVRGRILNLIGRSERGVGARKLLVQEISGQEANQFFDQYHIQGATGSIGYAIGDFTMGNWLPRWRLINSAELMRLNS
jgi:hypothetical protein